MAAVEGLFLKCTQVDVWLSGGQWAKDPEREGGKKKETQIMEERSGVELESDPDTKV